MYKITCISIQLGKVYQLIVLYIALTRGLSYHKNALQTQQTGGVSHACRLVG